LDTFAIKIQCLVDILAQPIVYSLEHIYMFIVNIIQKFYVVPSLVYFFKYIFFKIIEPYHELLKKNTDILIQYI